MKFPTKTLMCLIASQALVATAWANNPPTVPKPKPGETTTKYRAWKGQGFILPDRWDSKYHTLNGFDGDNSKSSIDPSDANETDAEPQKDLKPHYKKITNPTSYPARASGILKIGKYHCSAFLVSESIILTAAHCLVDESSYNFHDLSTAWFSPGLHLTQELRSGVSPSGSKVTHPYQKCAVRNAYVPKDYNSSPSSKRPKDYGFVFLKNCKIGAKIGYLGLLMVPMGSEGTQVTLRGYPARNMNEPYLSNGRILDIHRHNYILDARTAGYSGFSGGSLIAPTMNYKCRINKNDHSHCAVGILSMEFEQLTIQYSRVNSPLIFHTLWFRTWEKYLNAPPPPPDPSPCNYNCEVP